MVCFAAPLVVVRRKPGRVRSSLEFQHHPRFHFNWQPEYSGQQKPISRAFGFGVLLDDVACYEGDDSISAPPKLTAMIVRPCCTISGTDGRQDERD